MNALLLPAPRAQGRAKQLDILQGSPPACLRPLCIRINWVRTGHAYPLTTGSPCIVSECREIVFAIIPFACSPPPPRLTKINNQRGETYSGFDLAVASTARRTGFSGENGPKYRLNVERIVAGQLNGGGGPEISMRSQNGSIYIRKAK